MQKGDCARRVEGWLFPRKAWLGAVLLGGWLVAGCSPSGPKALVQGDELIQQGKYELAIEKLKIATTALPKNAQAWNHLGLAYHNSHQYPLALTAYRQALALDNNLAVAMFNLGSLHLEQDRAADALPLLTSFTVLRPDSAQGWLKLGLAHMRLRQYPLAAAPLTNALRLQADLPDAWNALGTIAVQKNRITEAMEDFSNALKYQPNYGPALLNLAVVLHENNKNHALALEKYRQYAALTPPPPNVDQVREMIAKLEQELAPPPAKVSLKPVTTTTNLIAQLKSAVESAGAQPAKQIEPTVTAPPVTPAIAETNILSKPAQVATNAPGDGARKAPTKPVRPSKLTPLPAATNVTDTVKVETKSELPKVEVAKTELPKPESQPETAKTAPKNETKAEPIKPLVLTNVSSVNIATQVVANKVETEKLVPAPGKSNPPPATMTQAAASPKALPGAYPYRAPAVPTGGDRAKATSLFGEGVQLQKDGRWNEAIAAYQKAIQADPSFFDAHYNLGLAAQTAGALPQALLEYEYALAVDPNSFEARYNFAMVLQKANYPRDAAAELERALELRPGDWRAHLVLANLYAKPLNQKGLARSHYRKVLELDPQNRQAPSIRAWLAENP